MGRGMRIRNTRQKINISLRELSKMTGVGVTEIHRIETDDRKNPNPKILRSIAKALGINYLELYLLYGYIDKEVLDGVVTVINKDKLQEFGTLEIINELQRRQRF